MTSNNSKSIILGVFLALFLFLPGLAICAELIPGPAPQVEVLSDDGDTIELSVLAGGLYWENVEIFGRDFARLEMPDAGVLAEVGSPRLPVIRLFVAIPLGGDPELDVINASTDHAYLPDSGVTLPIEPQQYPIPKVPGVLQSMELSMDSDVYSADRLVIGELASITDVFVWHGIRVALIEVYPVDLNPVRSAVDVLEQMTITIHVPGADMDATDLAIERFSTPDNLAMADALLVNPPAEDKGGVKQLDEAMVIISAPQFAYTQEMTNFISWKRDMGYDVILLTTDVTGSDANSVKAAIQNVYTTNTVPLTFALLVGDTDSIGYFTGQGSDSPATDLYFAAIDGADYQPDIGVGRLPVRDASQLANAINKMLNHEAGLWTAPDTWEKHAAFMASTDNYDITEGTHNYVINTYMAPRGWTTDKLYSWTYHATAGQVTASINAGLSFATYSGHGSETTWADGPAYNQSQVRALTNQVYPFVQSYACLTGSFEVSECFAETWIRATAGAAVFMGSSVSSFWDEDDIMERAAFDAFFGSYKADPLTWTYGMMDYGKMELLAYYGNTTDVRRYFEMYNIMGDPSLDIRSDVPVKLSMVTDDQLLCPLTGLQVTVPELPYVKVTLYSEGLLHASAVTGEDGTATFSFDAPIETDATIRITATKYNTIPAQKDVPVVDAGVRVDSFTATGIEYGVALDWQASVETGLLQYNLHRSETEDGEYALVAEGIAGGGSPYHYEDYGLPGGVTYFYKLEAVTGVGSVWYGPVNATTLGEGEPPEDDDSGGDDDDDSWCG